MCHMFCSKKTCTFSLFYVAKLNDVSSSQDATAIYTIENNPAQGKTSLSSTQARVKIFSRGNQPDLDLKGQVETFIIWLGLTVLNTVAVQRKQNKLNRLIVDLRACESGTNSVPSVAIEDSSEKEQIYGRRLLIDRRQQSTLDSLK